MYEKLLKLEKEKKLFQQEVYGCKWWDVCRYKLYLAIHDEMLDSTRGSRSRYVTNIKWKHVVQKMWMQVLFNIRTYGKCYDYLFLMASREKDTAGQMYDKLLKPIIDTISEPILKVETNYFISSDKRKDVMNLSFLKILKKSKRFLCRSKIELNYDINYVLQEAFEFSERIDAEQFIKDEIIEFNVEKAYYKRLCVKRRIKQVVLIQNGVQKALIEACHELNIPVIEIQHGHMNATHPLYVYDMNLDYSENYTFPNKLLRFSDYWGHNYPVKEVYTIGIPPKLDRVQKNKLKPYAIGFIISPHNTEYLLQLADEFLKIMSEEHVIIKLHPLQEGYKAEVCNRYKEYLNVKVVCNEYAIEEVLECIHSVVLIHSTCIYEALQCRKIVFVYKRQDYEEFKDTFSNKNVYLIDDVQGLLLNYKESYIGKEPMYFDEYNLRYISQVLHLRC